MTEIVEPSEDKPKTQKELEREKLLLEIEELKKKWWKKPTYIAALFPTLLALITLIYGFTNGYFEASYKALRAETALLQLQKENLEANKERLLRDQKELERQRDELQTTIERLTEEVEKYQPALEDANKTFNSPKRPK